MLAMRPRFHWYSGQDMGFMWVDILPENTVALDFDAPAPGMCRGGNCRGLFWSKVHNLCVICSEMFNLGHFWAFSTLSGFHVIFEKPSSDWPKILHWASRQWIWGPEIEEGACAGFAKHAMEIEFIELRVGQKDERPYDIRWKYGELDDAPSFVREHALYIQKLKEMNV